VTEKATTVRNEMGIHCRPSAIIMKAVSGYGGTIALQTRQTSTPLRSVMDLLSLGLQCGDQLTVRVEGPDEAVVCARVAELFETHFDFPPRPEGTVH
jgi:phosphocarrier protein HPr